MPLNTTDKSSTSRKLQRLKNQLYISDNSDIENIIDDHENQFNPNFTYQNNDPNGLPLTLPNGSKNTANSKPLYKSSTLPSRHTRKRERIDYNENKRVQLYVTTPAPTPSPSATQPVRRTRKRKLYSSSSPNPTSRSNTSKSYITDSNDSMNTTSNLTNNTENNNDDSKIDINSILDDLSDTNTNNKTDSVDSDIIDIAFLKRIVEADLNKKLSVLSDSDILVSTQPSTRSTITRRSNLHQRMRRMDELNSYMDDTLNDDSQDNENDNSGSLEDETQSHTDTTPPPQTIDEFTEKINDEIKSKYEVLSSSIVNDKQRQINSTINSIDKELNVIKTKFSKFKHHIENIDKKRSFLSKSSSITSLSKSSIKPLNFKPTFYPQIFSKQFEETDNKIHIESNLMTYSLIKHNFNKDINTETIMKRHISSFNENRESMKYFLRNKIQELDDEVQQRVGGTEIVALANVATMMDWSETNKLVDEAQIKLLADTKNGGNHHKSNKKQKHTKHNRHTKHKYKHNKSKDIIKKLK